MMNIGSKYVFFLVSYYISLSFSFLFPIIFVLPHGSTTVICCNYDYFDYIGWEMLDREVRPTRCSWSGSAATATSSSSPTSEYTYILFKIYYSIYYSILYVLLLLYYIIVILYYTILLYRWSMWSGVRGWVWRWWTRWWWGAGPCGSWTVSPPPSSSRTLISLIYFII